MSKKDNHYSLDKILSLKAEYNILFGERSNGKSYAVKYRAIEQAYKEDQKFVYMRRWLEDISRNRAESYFDDMEIDDEGNERIKEITGGEFSCISVFRNEIYLANRDENGKKIRGRLIGRVVVMSGDTHEKSRAFVGYYRIIFEEMITDKGYLANEVDTFMSLVSTILRRKNGEVFLIGNSLTKQCPFFREWELVNIPRQKIGTIDVYYFHTNEIDEDTNNEIVIKMAVEYCANTKGATKMVFGNTMISHGEWQCHAKEHLPEPYGFYEKLYSILILDELEYFALDILSDNNIVFLYVRSIDKIWTDENRYDIILTKKLFFDYKHVPSLQSIPKLANIVSRLYASNKIAFQDNLTGTSFDAILKNRKLW